MKKELKQEIRIYIVVLLITIVIGYTSSYVQASISGSYIKYDDKISLGATNVQAALDGTCTNFEKKLKTLMEALYPKGSIYMSTSISNSNDVATTLGVGKWEAFASGATLVGKGGSYTTVDGAVNLTTKTATFTPSGTISTYTGSTGSTALTLAQTPKGLARSAYVTGGAWSLGLWGAHGDGYVVTMADQTGYGTYGLGHSHTMNHSHTFSGTKTSVTISGHDPYTVVYMYKRVG